MNVAAVGIGGSGGGHIYCDNGIINESFQKWPCNVHMMAEWLAIDSNKSKQKVNLKRAQL